MKALRPVIAVVLAAFFSAAPLGNIALAQQAQDGQARSIVTAEHLNRALANQVSEQRASRLSIMDVLERDEVRNIAAGFGLDLRTAEAAVHTLEGDDLVTVAGHADALEQALSGGTTLQISLVAALLIVIIVILLVD